MKPIPEWIITKNNLIMRFDHSGELEVFCWRKLPFKWEEILDSRPHKPKFEDSIPGHWHKVMGNTRIIRTSDWSNMFPKSLIYQSFEKEEGLLAVVLYLQKNPSINEHTEVLLKSVK